MQHSALDRDVLYPRLIVIWAAMLLSVVLYFGVIELLKPSAGAPPTEPNQTLQTVLLGIAIGLAGASFPIRNQLLAKSRVARQKEHLQELIDPDATATSSSTSPGSTSPLHPVSPSHGLRFIALLVPLAMCEAAGVLGVVVYFLSGSPRYSLFLAIAIVGMLLHFPRRES